MPFFRRRFQSTGKTDKHEITWSNLAQNASAAQAIVLATTVDPADKSASTEVILGSHVKFLYLEFHFSAQTVTNPKVIHWTVEIIEPGQSGSTPSAYYQSRRSYIIKRGMEMLPADTSTVFKRIVPVAIPKLYQRRKDLSRIEFRYIASSTETINACGIAIYKEFY